MNHRWRLGLRRNAERCYPDDRMLLLVRCAPTLIVAITALGSGCESTMRPPGADADATVADGGFDSERLDVRRVDLFVHDVDPDASIFDDAGCLATYMRHNEDPGSHVPEGSAITWSTNPPTSGAHYEEFARWGIYREPVPRGYWVHNIEHGGIAVLYHCVGECTETRDQLERFVAALGPEPECVGSGVSRRVILTPDPFIDSPVAAVAWGWSYRAVCVDPPSLEAFVRARTGRAPKNLCMHGNYAGPRDG